MKHAGKAISIEDMAINLLMKFQARYDSFNSSLITSRRVIEMTWEE